MDFLIVAAATGAGYAAKYWKNQSKEEEAFSQLSFGESNLVISQSSNHLFTNFRKKRYEHVFGDTTMEESCSDKKTPLDIASVAEMASMTGFENEKLQLLGAHNDFNGIIVCNSSRRNRSRGNKVIFSNGDIVKPLSFVEDKLSMKSHFDDAENFCGVSQLPFKSIHMDSNKTGNEEVKMSKSCSKMANRELFAYEGTPDESFILYLGVFIGMIHSFISNKREVHKLKELLKETQYLVQDLQEEIETKHSFNMKELSNDNCESYTFSNAFSEKTGDESSPNHDTDYAVNFDVEELYEQKEEECSKSMSRIEAELEAELEILGLDINEEASERLAEEDEIGPEFEEDLAEGELRNEMSSGQSSAWTKANDEGSDTTVHSGNYTVSPWELSLRLQNVIQSRLEARIKKLEIELQNKNRKLLLVDAEYRSSCLELGNGEDESKFAI